MKQKYRGEADHDLSREIVATVDMPVIVNGDIQTVGDAQRVLEQTGAAGLMLGRGAINDHRLFERIRNNAPANPSAEERTSEVIERLRLLLSGYQEIFHGDAQVLAKFKEVIAHIDAPELARLTKRLRRAKSSLAIQQVLRA